MTYLLFRPIRIGRLELKNRVVMAPMGTGFAEGGEVSDRQINYFARRAQGGVGLIIDEVTAVDPSGLTSSTNTQIFDDDKIPGMKRLSEAIHKYGAKIAAQLWHAGNRARSEVTGMPIVAPSAIPAPGQTEIPEVLSKEGIAHLVKQFGEGARRVKEANFDAVELHGAHGYLIAQFLSPYSNKRTDEYGGDIRGRIRFALEIVEEVRGRVGRDFPISFRISGQEYVEDGLALEETKPMAKLLEEAGIDVLHVSAGHPAVGEWTIQPVYFPRGCLVDLASSIKSGLKIPVITVGRINDPDFAEAVLREGKADLVAMGRALVADPDLPEKAKAGKLKEIRRCIACNHCWAKHGELGLCCAINPEVGQEGRLNQGRVDRAKEVLVVGGGPAGLEAARVASLRGHKVILYEEAPNLGGQLLLAAKPPGKEEYQTLVEYYQHQLKLLNISIVTGTAITTEKVREIDPEVVIIATGAVVARPDIPGLEKPHVITAWDVLGKELSLDDPVVVLGGGQVGCEVADYLAAQGKRVTVLEILEEVAQDMEERFRRTLLKKLAADGVSILTRSKAVEVADDAIIYEDREGKTRKWLEARSVVLAMGAKSNDRLAGELTQESRQIMTVGDCVRPGDIFDAIHSGADAAFTI